MVMFDFNNISESFKSLMANASRRSVKLILLTGESREKQEFLNRCLGCSQLDIVNLGAVLSPRINGISRDSIGCEVLDFISGLHEDNSMFMDDIELLFDVGMDINVLSVLKYAARTHLLVVNWPGALDADGGLLYFARGDVQQKSYPIDSEIIVFDESGSVLPENI